jgi:hypothetical protein
MLVPAPFNLSSPLAFIIACAIALIIAAVAPARAITLPRLPLALMTLGLASLCLAIAGVTWRRAQIGTVAVVVDLSPSTRSAGYRDRTALLTRINQLLGKTPYTVYQMADGIARTSLNELPIELSSRQTSFTPLPVDAIVLFSDGQFPAPPAAPPVYSVIDPALDRPPDAAIERLEIRGETVATTLRNTSSPRELVLTNTQPNRMPIETASLVKTARIIPGATRVNGQMLGNDLWPENDVLEIRVPLPETAQRWWIGTGDAPAGWISLKPSDLPAASADYLAAACIVIDNLAADDISADDLHRLDRYVRNLGGGMLILGGDRAFAAGGYSGSTLEKLSPLASSPPQPSMQWMLLADSSGSMSAAIGENSRLHFAVNAMMRIIPLLPPDDLVTIGSFAQALRWWTAPRPARELSQGIGWPRDLRPAGPTNLAPALRLITDSADAAVPTQLLLITDAQANIDQPDQLASALVSKRISVHVITASETPPDNALRQIVQRTGGQFLTQSDPRQWALSVRKLLRSVSPNRMGAGPLTVQFTSAGPALPTIQSNTWNHTWLKPDATELAIGQSAAERVPAAAGWRLGSGAVIATAFATDRTTALTLADRVATPPRDSRFKISCDAAATLRISMTATDDRGPMNDLTPRLELSRDGGAAPERIAIPQVAPGRYEIELPAPTTPAFAAVYLDGRAIERFAVAGRYPPEFEHIGNDRPAMESLARATGGAVIEPAQSRPINFHWPTRTTSLTPYLAAASAALIAAALITWKRHSE